MQMGTTSPGFDLAQTGSSMVQFQLVRHCLRVFLTVSFPVVQSYSVQPQLAAFGIVPIAGVYV